MIRISLERSGHGGCGAVWPLPFLCQARDRILETGPPHVTVKVCLDLLWCGLLPPSDSSVQH